MPSTSEIKKHREDIISSVENLASRHMQTGANLGDTYQPRSNEEKIRKRVTFNESKEPLKENLSHSSFDTPSTPMTTFGRMMAMGTHEDLDDASIPRVQIVGTQEVYKNDPRQRRLNEIQARLKTRPTVTPFSTSTMI